MVSVSTAAFLFTLGASTAHASEEDVVNTSPSSENHPVSSSDANIVSDEESDTENNQGRDYSMTPSSKSTSSVGTGDEPADELTTAPSSPTNNTDDSSYEQEGNESQQEPDNDISDSVPSSNLSVQVSDDLTVGDWNYLQASGFEPGEIVDIELMFPDDDFLYEIGSALVGSEGELETEFFVPHSVEADDYVLVLTGDSSGRNISTDVDVIKQKEEESEEKNIEEDDNTNSHETDADSVRREESDARFIDVEDDESVSESREGDESSDDIMSGAERDREHSGPTSELSEDVVDNESGGDEAAPDEQSERPGDYSEPDDDSSGELERGVVDDSRYVEPDVKDDNDHDGGVSDRPDNSDVASSGDSGGGQIAFTGPGTGGSDSEGFDDGDGGGDTVDEKIISAGFVNTLGSMRPEAVAGLLAGGALLAVGAFLAVRRGKIRS